ncbi:MAG: hypothetical protein ACW97X_14715, partial [Candidatus Hodarchaeales archaeon]
MKHLFRKIPRSSYNTTFDYNIDGELSMHLRELLIIILMVFSLGSNLARADNELKVQVNEFYKPGDTIIITGSAGSSEVVSIEISNSLGLIFYENTTTNSKGEFSFSFNLTNVKLDLYELVLTSSNNQITTSFKVSNINQEMLAQYLMSLIKNSKEKIEFLLIELQIRGIETPNNASDYYEKGLVKMTEVQRLFNKRNVSGAIETSREALNNFQEVFRILYSDINFKDLEIDELTQIENSILQDIEQTENQYKKIRKTLNRIQVLGIRSPKLEELMNEAARQIEIAKADLENKKHQDSREDLENAKIKLKTAEQLL